MRTHTLKVDQEYMDALKSGEKTFEVRRDDRGFQKGDRLILARYGQNKRDGGSFGYMNPEGRVVSSYHDGSSVDKIERKIKYILTGGQFGIEPGHVVLQLSR